MAGFNPGLIYGLKPRSAQSNSRNPAIFWPYGLQPRAPEWGLSQDYRWILDTVENFSEEPKWRAKMRIAQAKDSERLSYADMTKEHRGMAQSPKILAASSCKCWNPSPENHSPLLHATSNMAAMFPGGRQGKDESRRGKLGLRILVPSPEISLSLLTIHTRARDTPLE
ncbi:hypothetical protein FA13DRAFT_1877376 [Coprinellus micaceus]|uniref:Uncharacterized protein n=1 Tax=Coprinellus micaceus TaxID=71717 RepID=A0A4Y7T0Q8_COPMI|nr:hypothetical protein FA13DRAFT_1877376 [Coprinellus micaceus]